jgi:lipoyl-dependent peroxiredoxin
MSGFSGQKESEMTDRRGSAQWQGDLTSGTGTLRVGDGVWEGAYSFTSRFEEGAGTNPEQLIAAAHAACFTMALSNMLSSAGHVPDSVHTDANVHLRFIDGAPTITRIDLDTVGRVPGIDAEQFEKFAEDAKANCVVSRALAGVPEMVLTARLA